MKRIIMYFGCYLFIFSVTIVLEGCVAKKDNKNSIQQEEESFVNPTTPNMSVDEQEYDDPVEGAIDDDPPPEQVDEVPEPEEEAKIKIDPSAIQHEYHDGDVVDLNEIAMMLGYEVVQDGKYPDDTYHYIFTKNNTKYYVTNSDFDLRILYDYNGVCWSVTGLGGYRPKVESGLGVLVKAGDLEEYMPISFAEDAVSLLVYLITTDEIDVYDIPVSTSYVIVESDGPTTFDEYGLPFIGFDVKGVNTYYVTRE